jgi:hypothetical protein
MGSVKKPPQDASYRSKSTSANIRRIEQAGNEAARQGTEAAKDLRRAAVHLKRASAGC